MRNMKDIIIAIAIMNMVLWSAFSAFAGNGKGAMDGSGPIASIFEGVPVTISGTISALPLTTDPGLKVDTDGAIVTVYGVPNTALQAMGYVPLTVGEDVTIECYEITFSDGSTKLIAVSITTGDQNISLRDAETGKPVWRGSGNGAGMNANMGNGNGLRGNGMGQRLRDGSCLQ